MAKGKGKVMKVGKKRVQTPAMGVIKELKGHAKNLVSKHGSDAVDKVSKHLERYTDDDKHLNAAQSYVGSKLKAKLPKELHEHVDKGLDTAKRFVKQKGKEYLKKGAAYLKNRISKVA